VNDLSVEFKSKKGWAQVIDNVSFDVAKGEVLGLVGESGSGKTVSSLGILRLLPRNGRVTAGEAWYGGKDLLKLPEKELRAMRGKEVSMIFQDALRCLNPAFTVGDQIAEVVRTHQDVTRAEAMARAKEMLELVEIPRASERLKDYPHQFSGGMCQRAMLALALACNPKLLFADEPTTALDVTVQSQVLNLIRSLQAELGLAVVFITHDLGVVADMCDRIAVMYAGQVVEIADRDDVFFRPTHPYTSGLLNSLPSGGAEEKREFGYIPGTVPSPGNWPKGCHFSPRCEYALEGPCTTDRIPLRPTNRGDRSITRCVRAEEITLKGVQDWTPF
jgi:oligopeptide/dipeptide ABC transporter ATP-binding protein